MKIKDVLEVIIIVGLMVALFLYLKDSTFYIGGMIWSDLDLTLAYFWLVLSYSLYIIGYAKKLKKSDKDERKGVWGPLILCVVIGLLMLSIFVWNIADVVVKSRNTESVEMDLGEGQSLILAESEYKFSSKKSNEITIYIREGIQLKKIGRQDEYFFLNNNIIRNGQYKVERDGDTVTVYYDYGKLVNGLTWGEEYGDNPPKYIECEYSLK